MTPFWPLDSLFNFPQAQPNTISFLFPLPESVYHSLVVHSLAARPGLAERKALVSQASSGRVGVDGHKLEPRPAAGAAMPSTSMAGLAQHSEPGARPRTPVEDVGAGPELGAVQYQENQHEHRNINRPAWLVWLSE